MDIKLPENKLVEDEPTTTSADTSLTEDTAGETPTDDCVLPDCVYVFITPIPGSIVVINGTKKRDGLLQAFYTLHYPAV